MSFGTAKMNTYFSAALFSLIFQAAVPGVLSFPENAVSEFRYDSGFVLGDTHIVGGKQVVPHSHPHQVGIILSPNIDTGFCGGALLSELWVVTAQHCTASPYMAETAAVVVGAHRIREYERSTQVLPIDNVFRHPGYVEDTMKNDISLIKLAIPAKLDQFVQPVRLPSQVQKDSSFWREQATVTGWGYESEKSKRVSSVLRGVDVRVVTNFYCTFRYFFQLVYRMNICTSGWWAKGTCNGDSGGPLTIKESDGKRTLIGISSFGAVWGCEKSWPTVYSRITSYLDWIHRITNIPKRK